MRPGFEEKKLDTHRRGYAEAILGAPFAAELERRTVFHDMWERTKVKEVTNPALKAVEWKSIAEIARERGVAPLDAFFDLALEDDLAVDYMTPLLDINEERVARKFSDPRTLIGISDGGAHVDMLCNSVIC
jgi:N-acyl-D-aspartate/D-glutamate deacylase